MHAGSIERIPVAMRSWERVWGIALRTDITDTPKTIGQFLAADKDNDGLLNGNERRALANMLEETCVCVRASRSAHFNRSWHANLCTWLALDVTVLFETMDVRDARAHSSQYK